MSNFNQLFNVNEGNVYQAFHSAEGVAANSNIDIGFTTPANPASDVPKYQTIRAFFLFSASGADFGGCDLQVKEAPSALSGGSAAVWRNMNRKCGKVPDVLSVANVVGGFTTDPTTITGGTVIHKDMAGHGNIGGMDLLIARLPLLLNVNTDYVATVTSDTADTTLMLRIILEQIEN